MAQKKAEIKIQGVDRQIVRVDLRIPIDLYARLQEVADAMGIKPHHATGRPMIAPVILELIEIGLRYYQVDDRIEKILSQLREELAVLISKSDR